jgi:hypothetical protein
VTVTRARSTAPPTPPRRFRFGLVDEARHHEMAQDEPAPSQAPLVDDEIADLGVHLLDRAPGGVGIVAAR